MRSSTPEAASVDVERVLRAQREFLFPCIYPFFRRPPLLVGAEDCELIGADGRRYLDFYSGVTVVNAGHCNREIQSAAIAQMQRLDHTTSIHVTEPAVRLAQRLADLYPPGIKRSFFCATGSEANEAALLLATLHSGRSEFVALDGGLHGRTKAAMSATGLPMWRTDPFPLATFHFAPRPDEAESLERLERVIAEAGPRRIAALLAEPVQGNGGIVLPPADYWPRVRELCERHGILLIFDEIQTGMNRTGRWWAAQHWDVTPDILTSAKALANGYPLSVVATTDEIAAAWSRPGASTFGGNPVAAATALATLAYHERERLGPRAMERGGQLVAGLARLAGDFSILSNPRGLGLMVAIDVLDGAGQAAPARLDALLEELKDRGALAGKTGPQRNVLTLMPPLTIAGAQVEAFLDLLRQALAAVNGSSSR